MAVPEGPKPIYTIYNGVPTGPVQTESRGMPSGEYGRPAQSQPGLLRMSSQANYSNYSAQPAPIASRGSYSHLVHKAAPAPQMPSTPYHLSGNTHVYLK